MIDYIKIDLIFIIKSIYTMSDKSIYFFRTNNNYGFLSNFFPITFCINNIEFSCSEQAFMYFKCKYFEPTNNYLLNSILQEYNPHKIKLLGRKVRNFKESAWSEVKYTIMIKCIRAKFECNEKYKQKLIETSPSKLYEASPYDRIWGIGYDSIQAKRVNPKHYGENLLGKALEEIRAEFLVQNKI